MPLEPTDEAAVLKAELVGLFQYVNRVRDEIAAMHRPADDEHHLPSMSDQLDAIVDATEEATNTIMDATEQIEGLMDKVDPEDASVIMEATSTIYEACGFQDITGQRTTKVVKALKDIEEKIDALVEAFGSEIEKFKNDNPKADEESGRELTDEDLLEGPQLEEQAQTQEEYRRVASYF